MASAAESEQPLEQAQLVAFKLGQRFKSFEELREAVTKYETTKCVKLWIRDSRTVVAARKRLESRYLSDRIKYYEIAYCCIHGGKKFTSRGTGKRSTSTFKKDCPFKICLAASKDGNHLEIRSLHLDHNHECTREVFKLLPHERLLSSTEKHEVNALLSLKANKKLVQDKMISLTGKQIILKDLSNIQSQYNNAKTRNDLETCVRNLTDKHGATVDIVVNDSGMLMGIFFQDQEMKNIFAAFPEILFIDATYKLLEIRFPVFLLLIEDGNGQSEIVAVFLVLEENQMSLKKMLAFFKKHNEKWPSIRIVMSDKDLNEREVIMQEMPDAQLLICLFHCFRSFRREITINKMGITPGERDMCLSILQKLAYATDEDTYDDLYKQFSESAPRTVKEYFDTEWHPIKSQWTMGMKFATGNFLNSTNNRLECINSKLKSVISRHSSLEDFIENIFIIIRSMRGERNYKAALMSQKVPVLYHSTNDSSIIDYMKFLTPYAFKFVRQQIESYSKVCIESSNEVDFLTTYHRRNISSTCNSCSCYFRQSLRLPSKHIFAVRFRLLLPLFERSLCDERWSSLYYMENQRVYRCVTDSEVRMDCQLPSVDVHTVKPTKKRKKLSQMEKFHKMSKVATQLASLASEVSMKQFRSRYSTLEELVSNWEKGNKVRVIEDSDDSDCSDESDLVDCNLPPSHHSRPFTYSNSTSTVTTTVTATLTEARSATSTDPLPVTQETALNSIESLNYTVSMPTITPASEASNANSSGPLPVTQKTALNSLESDAITLSGSIPGMCDEGIVDLSKVSVPPRVSKRGRPKGRDLTVIGLPAKKQCPTKKKLLPFIKLHPSIKEQRLLKMFVDESVMKRVTHSGSLIEEEEVEVRPEHVSIAVLDENVNHYIIRKYFTSDAWLAVESTISLMKENPLYICQVCSKDINDTEDTSIACELCLSWYHMKCVGLVVQPKVKYWFCMRCRRQ